MLAFFDSPAIREAVTLIGAVAECSTIDDVNDAIIEYQRRLARSCSWFSYVMKLRISCAELIVIYHRVLSAERAAQTASRCGTMKLS